VYSSNTIVGEVILIIIAFFLNWFRITQGTIANKSKNGIRFAAYFLFSILIIIGFVYIVNWQPYVYWLEFIQAIIALIVISI
jgi:hypothetical protein